MLCFICGLRELEITISDTPNYLNPLARPEIVSIICKSRGTGSLSRCRYPPGSREFNIASELYWLRIENARAIADLMRRQDDYIQSVTNRLYEHLLTKEVNRVSHAQASVDASLKVIPGQLNSYDPDNDTSPDQETV